jgi:hypothetical protein
MRLPATVALAMFSSMLLCGSANATPPPPRAGSEPAANQSAAVAPKDETGKQGDAATPPAKKSPQKAPRKMQKRRAVRQQLDDMPRMAAPPPAYAPQLSPPSAVPHTPSLPPMPIPSPQARDGSYKGGVGTTLLSPQGKICSDNGITVQCF